VAVPGDEMEFDGVSVKVNGKIIDKNNKTHNLKRLTTLLSKRGQRISIPPEKMKLKHNQYFVMGDNRNYSTDSRDFGPVDSDSIINIVDK
jgi:signal peptidase I